MLRFDSDYMEGAHESILARLCEMNLMKITGYGRDEICVRAKEKILNACGCRDGEVHFLVGGTQTNATVIDALLRPYQSVIAAQCGHINVHESGAIEACGHKVIPISHKDGLIETAALEEYLSSFYADPTYEHMPIPAMVYISHPSELGAIYSKKQLEDISSICHKYGLYLYLDGARLGYGLASPDTDVTMEDIARLCDVFYIGGTKVGALFGEAVVFTRPGMCPHFFTTTKQHGALLAKGWLLGVQFDTLFTDGLYMKIAANAIDKARKLREVFLSHGYSLFSDSPTNQQFFTMTRQQFEDLSQKAGFELWQVLPDDMVAVRFVTSWATDDEQIAQLGKIL